MTGSIHLCCLGGLSKTARFIKQFTCKVHETAFKRRHDLGYTGVFVFCMFGDQTSQHHATSTDLKPALIPGMGSSPCFSSGWNLQVVLVFRSERAKETYIFLRWNIWNPPRRLEQNDKMDPGKSWDIYTTTYNLLQLLIIRLYNLF